MSRSAGTRPAKVRSAKGRPAAAAARRGKNAERTGVEDPAPALLAAWALRASERGWALVRAGAIAAINPSFEAIARAGAKPRTWSAMPLLPGEHLQRHEDPAWVGPSLRALVLSFAAIVGTSGQRPRTMRRRFRSGDGCVIECRFERARLGATTGVLVLVEDITDQARAEEELSAAQASLMRQQRLRVAGELAIGIGHDMNNLLGALELRLHTVLRDGSVASPAEKQAAERILHDGKALVERLQNLGRSQVVAPVAIGVHALVHSALELAESAVRLSAAERGRRVRFDVRLPPRLPRVIGNPDDLRHVLLNIFLNARDAISARRREGVVRVEASAHARTVELRVIDDGAGIARAALPHIFQAFYSTKPHGTGIGLTMAKAVVERVGGRIHAHNVAGGGACFVVELMRARLGSDRARDDRDEDDASAAS